MNKQRRKVLVFSSLLVVVSLTSVILLALSPRPLNPHDKVVAAMTGDRFEKIYETQSLFQPALWQYIYIHHSKTLSGDGTRILGDHFLIGNGEGCDDGEIQVTGLWNQQSPARPVGLRPNENCITICLVGDFDRGQPTDAQVRRLAELVRSLQQRCSIAAENVVADKDLQNTAGIGRNFPLGLFRQELIN